MSVDVSNTPCISYATCTRWTQRGSRLPWLRRRSRHHTGALAEFFFQPRARLREDLPLHTVDRPGGNPDHPLNADDWKYSTGFINEAMVKEHLPAPADDVCTFMCGPPMMLEKACIPNLKRVGHEEFNIFAF